MRTNRRLFNLVQGDARFDSKISNAAGPGDDNAISLYLYDEISPFGVLAADFVAELAGFGGQPFNLHVNSPGGDVFEGLAMLNTLRAYPGRVTAYVDGIAASAASFILMGADEVVMARNSELMIHDAWGMCLGNASDMVDMAQRLDKVSDNIADVYASRAGKTTEHWRNEMKAESWYGADEAVAAGLATRSLNASSSTEGAVAYDLSRFANHKKITQTPVPPAPVAQEKDPFADLDISELLRRAFKEAA